MQQVLIVDDNPSVCTALEILFDVHGIPTIIANTPEAALEVVARGDVGAVIQDMNFSDDTTSGQEGAALFRRLRELDGDLPVLLMTAWTSLETAVLLVKEGAADYLAKPWDDAKVVTTVKNMLRLRELALENHRLRAQSARARNELQDRYDLCGLVYASEAMHRVVSLAASVARADAPVLISGPNGSGKEKVAEIVHANSPRRQAPFVKVNAGGLPDDLLEAELFGAEVGAFTGATKRRIGRFEAADGGTLFLDEIGNLTLRGQVKLLRVLQTGEFERLGSTVTRKVDVRIVSATNANLRQMIAAGSFREDLLFRLNVIEIRISPLRERSEDVLPLAEHFLHTLGQAARLGEALDSRNDSRNDSRVTGASTSTTSGAVTTTSGVVPSTTSASISTTSGVVSGVASTTGVGPTTLTASTSPVNAAPPTRFSPAAVRSMLGHDWPGNVRELQNRIQRAILLCHGGVVEPGDLGLDDASIAADTVRPRQHNASEPSSRVIGNEDTETERRQIVAALEAHAGVVARAAAELGLSRQALYRRMDRLGISLERQLRQS
ncbi:MAG TPA: sigma-54 dependent transcriptional regulator [Nannocystis sp.]|jgi:DNA-binding NtrC family response regulator